MKKKEESKVSAPGKIILSGEYAVVYGYPALVAAVNKRLVVNNNSEITSDIPIGCGMGSSAAYAVAISAMKLKKSGKKQDRETIYEMAYEMEKGFHGNPSGVDPAISTYGGFLWYRKESEQVKLFSKIKIGRKPSELLIVNTGKPEESTREMVVDVVGKAYLENKNKITASLRGIEAVSRAFLRYLMKETQEDAGELIRENEKYLEEIGAVSESSSELIRKIENMGGAAKISGAGGRRGASGIILIYHPDMAKLKAFLTRDKLEFFRVKLGEEGVKDDEKS